MNSGYTVYRAAHASRPSIAHAEPFLFGAGRSRADRLGGWRNLPIHHGHVHRAANVRIQASAGFTLIEVLVVVAIIALLLAILLPSLTRVRQQAQQAKCASNMHQMALALNVYAVEFDHTPAHHDIPNAANASLDPLLQSQAVWPRRLHKMANRQHEIFWCPTAPPYTYWNGKDAIVRYHTTGMNLPGMLGTFSYGYNDWGMKESVRPHLGLGAYAGHRDFGEQKIDRVRMPAEMIAIADNDMTTEADALSPYNGLQDWDTAIDPREMEELPGNRHNKGANVAFVDGHAEFIMQKLLIERRPRMMQRWNIDWESHEDLWPIQ